MCFYLFIYLFIYLFLFLFFQSMASKSYEAGFKKYYENRLDNISNKTTEEEIKRLYDDWAGEYEEVINMYTWYHPRKPWDASRADGIFSESPCLKKTFALP